MDLQRCGYTIQNFLRKYQSILIDEHKLEIQSYYEILQKYKNSKLIRVGYNDFHYDICPYATETSSEDYPDTCGCIMADNIVKKAVKLINLYIRIKHK